MDVFLFKILQQIFILKVKRFRAVHRYGVKAYANSIQKHFHGTYYVSIPVPLNFSVFVLDIFII